MDETNQLHDLKKQINVRLSAAKIRFTQSSLECSVVTYTWDSKKVEKKPAFVQANSNSSQGHVLHYIVSFWVVFSLSTLYFWLAGKTETKQVVNRMSKGVEGGGSWKGHESGRAVFVFLAASPLSRAPNKTAMLHRLAYFQNKGKLSVSNVLCPLDRGEK